ncbi:MAG TPA: hypothetical protein VLS92_08805, partial [Acidimicrobiia bacterium]|nr:hypothetical protein [Acidimicrobiia bacterium]
MMLPGRPLLRPLGRVWIGLVLAGAVLGSACGAGAGAGPTNAAIGSTTGLAATTAAVTTIETPSTTPTTVGATTSTSITSTTTSVPATTSTTLPAWWRPVTPEDPLRVWVVGDSLGGPLGNALAARVRATGLVVVTIDFEDGSGLVRDDVFDWPGYAAQRLPQV